MVRLPSQKPGIGSPNPGIGRDDFVPLYWLGCFLARYECELIRTDELQFPCFQGNFLFSYYRSICDSFQYWREKYFRLAHIRKDDVVFIVSR